ncbi:MAG: hypothetical protein FJ087_16895, partial [Deltaproteobacteria bacterium]|nr:hypothetical protein [Deltaproteobacteria bacterium]
SMIRLAVEGSASLAKLREEARLLGIVLSKEDIDAAEAFGDNLDRMKLSLVGVANSIIRRFVPDMDKGAKGITEWIVANRELIATKVEAALRKVGEYLTKIGDWFVAHENEIRRVFVDGFDLAARAVTTIGENIDLVIAAVKTLAITWVAGKLVGGFTSAIEAAEKLKRIWQGMPGFGTPGAPTSNAPIPVPGGGPPAPTGKWQGFGNLIRVLPAAGAGLAISQELAPQLRRMAEERFGAGKQWAVTDAILGDKAILGGIDRLRAIAEHGTRVETVVTFNNAPPGMVVDSVTTNGAPAAAQVNVNRGDSRMATGAP